jgi:carboxypeptidase Q
MEPLNATEFQEPTDGGPDIEMWSERGFPAASLLNKNDRYFWFHHSDGDSMNVWESKDTLDKCTALWAAASYVIADLSINIPRTLKEREIS